jgi:protocatechuate 3,4-dioxygenase beta subunit
MISRTRRRLLGSALVLPFAARPAFGQSAPLTPSCGKDTPRQTEGPFFTPRSPERVSLLERDAPADGRFVLTGIVLSSECKPVPSALVDFWHADQKGEYDNQGYRYRGHQRTDAQGRYRLETIVPGLYPGRTRHFHVKVQAPAGGRALTTQLYFPGEPGNARDGIYRPDLEVKIGRPGEGSFDFVVMA